MKRRTLLAAGLAASACANPLSRPYPEKRLYVLEAKRPTGSSPSGRPRVLLLRAVTAAPGAEGRGLVTRLPGNVQNADFWNEFFAPPADMVHDAMRRWLGESGLFAAVLDPGSRSRADLALETRLIALFGDGTDPRAPSARVHLQTLLLGLERDPPRILARGDYDRRVPIPTLAPEVLAPALSQALALALADLEADLRRVLG
ncbi:MAG: ABC-type transport auxiliary lipoprotein family protein [Elioraea sp.]|nr:ABC-type transport auxiliary lipoprotein family protein [Elioraea sp.]MDW8443144.1 hypothetical protein [Acetobacteraceae bacterium]